MKEKAFSRNGAVEQLYFRFTRSFFSTCNVNHLQLTIRWRRGDSEEGKGERGRNQRSAPTAVCEGRNVCGALLASSGEPWFPGQSALGQKDRVSTRPMARDEPLATPASCSRDSLGYGVAPATVAAGDSPRRALALAALAGLALAASALASSVLVPQSADLCQTVPGAKYACEQLQLVHAICNTHSRSQYDHLKCRTHTSIAVFAKYSSCHFVCVCMIYTKTPGSPGGALVRACVCIRIAVGEAR